MLDDSDVLTKTWKNLMALNFSLREIYFNKIFLHLSVDDLLNIRCVCRIFFKLINEYFQQVQYLDCSSSNSFKAKKSNWPKISMLIYKNKSISELNLMNCKWVNEKRFIELIRSQNHLKSINLSWTFHITRKSLATIALYCPVLERISLENCSWLQPFEVLLLADNCSKLSHLNLGSCWNLNDETIRQILEKRGKSIKSLNLSKIYSLSDSSMSSIKSLAHSLYSLDIKYCWKVTDEGLRYVVWSKKKNSHSLNLFQECLPI